MVNMVDYFDMAVLGGILGFAVGDALGVSVEFQSRAQLRKTPVTGMRSGGTHGQPAGTWSDDTSMTLCTIDSLTERGVDYTDQMRRFSLWLNRGAYTPYGEVFDVGGTTGRTVSAFDRGTAPLDCGEKDERSCGNGSLMRILPTVLYLVGRYGYTTLDDRTAEIIHNTSACTHAHPRCQMACGIYASVVFSLCAGRRTKLDVRAGIVSALSYYREKPAFSGVFHDFENLKSIGNWEENQISGSGYVLHTLQAALWCLLNTNCYEECVCKAVNLGEDTDTTAAVAGGLAGIVYGKAGIPQEWLDTLANHEQIETQCARFYLACIDKE